MKMPVVRSYSCHTVYSGRDSKTWHVDLWRQPLYRWLIARIYHWYDMRIEKVPGVKWIQRLIDRRRETDLWYIPVSNERDIRCYHLGEKQKVIITSFDITEEVFRSLVSKNIIRALYPEESD